MMIMHLLAKDTIDCKCCGWVKESGKVTKRHSTCKVAQDCTAWSGSFHSFSSCSSSFGKSEWKTDKILVFSTQWIHFNSQIICCFYMATVFRGTFFQNKTAFSRADTSACMQPVQDNNTEETEQVTVTSACKWCVILIAKQLEHAAAEAASSLQLSQDFNLTCGPLLHISLILPS